VTLVDGRVAKDENKTPSSLSDEAADSQEK
jgi:hypothetical protein